MSRRSSWKLWLGCATAGVLSGCLAFGDYELSDEPGASTGSPTMPTPGTEPSPSPSDGECENGDYSCVRQQLLICSAGAWSLQRECLPEEVCSADLRACVACDPGRDYDCDGDVLSVCSADGKAYDLVEDCGAEGLLCDTQLVPDSCFECVGPERRCSGTVLAKCVGHSFGGGTPCTIQPGCIPGGDSNDYCAECSTPGEEACSETGERTRCNDSYRFELIEPCPFGCQSLGATVSCIAAAN